MTSPAVTIFHNPACGTSRNTLAAIRESGVEPTVVEYLKTGWSQPQLTALLARMGKGPRDILRVRGTPASFNAITVEDDCVTVVAMGWTGSHFEPYRTWSLDRRARPAQ